MGSYNIFGIKLCGGILSNEGNTIRLINIILRINRIEINLLFFNLNT